jgi:glycosyltransferase involved in cell wall biosynthesis
VIGRNRRILFISWYDFEAADSGERVRASALCRELERQFQVTTLCLDGARVINRGHALSVSPESVIPYGIPKTAYLRSTIRGMAIEEYLVNKAAVRNEVEECIDAVGPEAIVAVQPYVWPLVPSKFRSITVVDTHNINSARLRRLADSLPSCDPRKLILRRQVHLSRKFERSYSKLAGQVWTVSADDADHIDSGFRHRVRIVPNGANFPSECPKRRPNSTPLRLLFFGSLDYSANLDGLRVLRHWIDNDVISWRRDVRITVAGRGDANRAVAIIGQHSAFDLIGRVASPAELYRQHDCLIVPLRQGGGSRLKVMEAVASGLPVISTEIGVEGTGLKAGEDYLRAESPEDLVKQIELLRHNDQLIRAMIASAFAKAAAADWATVGSQAGRFIRELVAERSTNESA